MQILSYTVSFRLNNKKKKTTKNKLMNKKTHTQF